MNPGPEDGKEPGDYQPYLLRLWRVSDDEEPAWRASPQSPRSGEQVSGADQPWADLPGQDKH